MSQTQGACPRVTAIGTHSDTDSLWLWFHIHKILTTYESKHYLLTGRFQRDVHRVLEMTPIHSQILHLIALKTEPHWFYKVVKAFVVNFDTKRWLISISKYIITIFFKGVNPFCIQADISTCIMYLINIGDKLKMPVPDLFFTVVGRYIST